MSGWAGLSFGAKLGIVLAVCLVGIMVVIGIVFTLGRRRRGRIRQPDHEALTTDTELVHSGEENPDSESQGPHQRAVDSHGEEEIHLEGDPRQMTERDPTVTAYGAPPRPFTIPRKLPGQLNPEGYSNGFLIPRKAPGRHRRFWGADPSQVPENIPPITRRERSLKRFVIPRKLPGSSRYDTDSRRLSLSRRFSVRSVTRLWEPDPGQMLGAAPPLPAERHKYIARDLVVPRARPRGSCLSPHSPFEAPGPTQPGIVAPQEASWLDLDTAQSDIDHTDESYSSFSNEVAGALQLRAEEPFLLKEQERSREEDAGLSDDSRRRLKERMRTLRDSYNSQGHFGPVF
ncbi:MAG: hypothetical protein M1824_004044 [Vezdaea acicularis]|nr:MAG: hypothetical protein M1824_004044 [Vezdaea acicularis]